MPPAPILHVERRVDLVAAQFVTGDLIESDVPVLLRLSPDGLLTFEAGTVRATFEAEHLRTAFLLVIGEEPDPPPP